MRVLDRTELVRKELEAARAEGGRPGLRGRNAVAGLRGPNAVAGLRGRNAAVGLVPTMGALHEGHASLIRRSAAECDVTLVTVFVNPLQFGPGEDFDRYPRDLSGDVALAAHAGADLVFAPPVEEMYPEPPLTRVEVGGLSERLEGAVRPGHFAGVATVVAKLFAIAGPCRAYFGEKDYQQLLVVRRLAADLSFPVEVVGCPTVREADGLAMSSRNAYLSPDERVAATVLNRALTAAAAESDAGRMRRVMADVVGAEPLAHLDYAEVADPETLQPLEGEVASAARLLVAVQIGATRLIDNLGVTR